MDQQYVCNCLNGFAGASCEINCTVDMCSHPTACSLLDQTKCSTTNLTTSSQVTTTAQTSPIPSIFHLIFLGQLTGSHKENLKSIIRKSVNDFTSLQQPLPEPQIEFSQCRGVKNEFLSTVTVSLILQDGTITIPKNSLVHKVKYRVQGVPSLNLNEDDICSQPMAESAQVTLNSDKSHFWHLVGLGLAGLFIVVVLVLLTVLLVRSRQTSSHTNRPVPGHVFTEEQLC